MIPCFYDMKLGIQLCRLDGYNWSWPFTMRWVGQVDAEWVRANATQGAPI